MKLISLSRIPLFALGAYAAMICAGPAQEPKIRPGFHLEPETLLDLKGFRVTRDHIEVRNPALRQVGWVRIR